MTVWPNASPVAWVKVRDGLRYRARTLQAYVRLGSECENLAMSKCFLLNLDKLTLLITIASTESGQLIPIGSRI